MVRIVLSKYGDSPPSDSSSSRKIQTQGPLNPPDEVLEVLKRSLPKTMTRKSIADLQRLGFDDQDLKVLIMDALQKGRYIDSEWCETSPESPWFACDSYELNRKEYNESSYKDLDVYYFLKFCINKAGKLICTFSCHLSY
ncbi:hypothetical protein [Acinetobacter sp. YH12035]|uniref:hypothetical protein n=1 Tax=Acinetobacter sp. YH12035 TaxID=2601045 RepID=UPI001C554EDF|nr:hypothetical protein [Acinetobacter sp. YH12035]